MRFRARRFDNGEFVTIELRDGLVSCVESGPSLDGLPWVAPGFVDLQIGGFRGRELNDRGLDVDKVIQLSLSLDAVGVTRFCPTATTQSFELISHVFRTMALACEQSREARQRIAAFHLEGPYISNEDGPRGAHPSAYCRPPDWDEFERFQEAAGGRIGVLTMSPEYDGSARFIERAVSSGVLVAIGHTKATSQQIWEAVDAGARMSTHLGNGSHALIPRHANYVWDQAAEDRLVASLIVDGHHLPPAVVKCLVRAKTPQRCVLISDLVGDAGLPPGRYRNATVGEIEVLDDGRIVIAGQRQYLAGAGLPLAHGVANVMRFAGLDLRTAIEMAAVQPATLLGLEPAGLTPGERADLILFDLPDGPSGPIRVRATVNCGERVFGVIDGV